MTQSTVVSQEAYEEPAGELGHSRVGALGSLAQSVGLIGPSAGAGLLAGAVLGVAGPLSWLIWVIGIVAISCVGFAVSILSRRFLTTGGLYPLSGRAGGRLLGYFTAFGALWWIILGAPAVLLSAGIFAGDFLSLPAFGLKNSTSVVITASVVVASIASYVAYRGIKLSVRALLLTELVTIGLIFALDIYTLFKHPGGAIDHQQFHFAGTSFSTLLAGIVLVTFAFGGFESATVLGKETRHGRRNIPLAVMSSILVSGLFLGINQYAVVLGFSGTGKDLTADPDYLGTLAKVDGIGWYSYVVTFALVLAAVANNIAIINAGARMVFTLPEEGVGPRRLRQTSKHETPSVGILFFVAVDLIAVAVIGIFVWSPVSSYGNLGGLSGDGAVVMYAMICVATIVFLVRQTRKNVPAVGVCVLGAVIIIYGGYKSYVPFPRYPGSVVAWVFAGGVAAAIVGYLAVRGRRAHAFEGQSVEDGTLAEVTAVNAR